MKGLRRIELALLVAAIGCVVLVVAGGTGAAVRGAAKTTAVFAELPGEPTFYIFPLTPMTNYNGQNDGQFQDLMYRPLYWFGAGAKPVLNEPISLAYPPTYTHGGRVAVVRLKSYRWSDGAPVTSRDVVFWMNLLKVAKNNWAGYVPGEFPDNVVKVTASGPRTVVFTFDRVYNPDWILYNELSQVSPMPQHAWDKTSSSGRVGNYDLTAKGAKAVYAYLLHEGNTISTYATNPLWKVVDGPWTIKTFETNNYVELVPNRHYSGADKPHLSMFVMQPFTSDAAEFNDLLAGGNIDFGYMPAQDIPQISRLKARGYEVHPSDSWSINYTVLNYNNPTVGPIFRQLYVRQAMQHLIDQQTYVKAAFGGYGAPTYGPVPFKPDNPFLTPFVKSIPYKYSPSTAASLLRSHGWKLHPNGASTCVSPGAGGGHCGAGIAAGAQLSFRLEYASGISSLERWIQGLQSAFSSVGLKIQLVPEPLSTLNANEVACKPSQSKCKWQMVQGDLAWTFQPDYYPEGSLIFSTGAGSNAGQYSNATADRLIRATHVSRSPAAMAAYENYLAKQLPVLWTPKPESLWVIRSSLKGTHPEDPLGSLYPEDWYWGK